MAQASCVLNGREQRIFPSRMQGSRKAKHITYTKGGEIQKQKNKTLAEHTVPQQRSGGVTNQGAPRRGTQAGPHTHHHVIDPTRMSDKS